MELIKQPETHFKASHIIYTKSFAKTRNLEMHRNLKELTAVEIIGNNQINKFLYSHRSIL